MALPLQDFPTMVKTQAAAVTASCQQLIDTTVGSVLRALLEANASVGLWMQWLIGQVLATTRASTSNGSDLDSWVADFGMERFPAVAASGAVVFSRATPGLATTVGAGALVRTGTSTTDQVFSVVADPTNSAWTATGYAIGAGAVSITVPVVAVQPGAAGNVVAQSVTTLATAIPGIDAVTNPAPMAGGLDAESDTALRSRFAGFLDSRVRATAEAVGFAIASVRQGLTYTIADRVDPAGETRAGHFTVTVDDGSGAPSATLINAVANAIEQVRPIGSTFSIRPPLVLPTNVQLQITGPATALLNVQNAITTYLNSMPIGMSLTLTRLYQLAYSGDSTVTNASGALINGSGSDYIPPIYGLLRPATITVTS